MNYTPGIHAITRVSETRPADNGIGTQTDVEIGWIDFHRTILLADENETLDLQMKYTVSKSGLLLVAADGSCGGRSLIGDIVYGNQLHGTIIKLRR